MSIYIYIYIYIYDGKQRCNIFVLYDFYNIVVQIRRKLYM